MYPYPHLMDNFVNCNSLAYTCLVFLPYFIVTKYRTVHILFWIYQKILSILDYIRPYNSWISDNREWLTLISLTHSMYCSGGERIGYIHTRKVKWSTENITLSDIVAQSLESHMTKRYARRSLPECHRPRIRDDETKILEWILLHECIPKNISTLIWIFRKEDTFSIGIRLIDPSICCIHTTDEGEMDIFCDERHA